MKAFYFKLLIFQTLLYGSLLLAGDTEAVTPTGKLLWKPVLITFYTLSVIVTFVIPMIREVTKKKR